MVAIVSGNTLGLSLTSKGVLGDQGVSGDPLHGKAGEQVYVNAATGNLVMQQLQDELVGAGLNVNSVLTYNSLGLANDDNGDNFSLGKVSVQLALTGPVNAVGSKVTRTAFDGSNAAYLWNSATASYRCVNGTGAFDTITFSSATSKYTWVDGATQTKEVYDGSTKRLLTRTDAAGNALTFGYDSNGQLHTISTANGGVVTYAYNGSLLTEIDAPVTNPQSHAVTAEPVVKYGYDLSNRLTSVTVDLSPLDGSIADGEVYVTSFTYDGASKRIATMRQTDGTLLTFGYDASNRVRQITDALSNLTTFAYDTVSRKTSVTANGQTTVFGYDLTTGMLTSITQPPVNGVSAVNQYVYNANGQLTSVIDGDGRTTTFGYDASGNQTSVVDPLGNLTTRTYDAQNRLITESSSTLGRPSLVAAGAVSIVGDGVTKTGATAAWDAAVRSGNSISGAAAVSFVATQTSGDLVVGLNSDPDTDATYPLSATGAGDALPDVPANHLVERFVAGRAAKCWYWNAQPVALEVLEPPQVIGDGHRSIAQLLSDPRGSFDRALPVEEAVPMLALQGLGLATVLARDAIAQVGFRYVTPFDRMTLLDRDCWATAAPAWRETFARAGAVLHAGLPAPFLTDTAFTVDAVIDGDDKVWFLEMNSHPMLHPAIYAPMLDTLLGGAYGVANGPAA